MRLRNSFSSAALPLSTGRSPNLTTQSSVKPASSAAMFHGINRDSTWATKARASSTVRGFWPAIANLPKIDALPRRAQKTPTLSARSAKNPQRDGEAVRYPSLGFSLPRCLIVKFYWPRCAHPKKAFALPRLLCILNGNALLHRVAQFRDDPERTLPAGDAL